MTQQELKKIEDLVAVKPIPEEGDHARGKAVCPYCSSTDTWIEAVETTLVGGRDFWRDNHAWSYCSCSACKKKFVRESKYGYVWYTDKRYQGRVLCGMPCCYENYVYPCGVSGCSGEVRSHYTDLKGQPTDMLHSVMIDGKSVPQYRVFYICDACGARNETADKYWCPPAEGRRPTAAAFARGTEEWRHEAP